MTHHSATAEYDALNAVRVHTPGPELLTGSLDPERSLFFEPVAPERARREHRHLIETFERAGVEVHQLADDLAAAGALDELVREVAAATESTPGDVRPIPDVDAVLDAFDAREKLGLVLSRPRLLDRDAGAGEANWWGRSAESTVADVRFERPISNMYFQRDHNLLGDEGPIVANMYDAVRQPEIPLVRTAWEGVGADVAHQVTDEPIEGGDFVPAGDFALVGTSAVVDGEEEILRTSYAAGEQLLDAGAIGFEEVGLVRAPLEAGRAMAEEYATGSRVLHLDGWLNVAAEGLAVTRERLAAAAEVDVYERRGDEYRRRETTTVLSYLDEKGYDTINPDWLERWPTNFLTVDDGTVVAIYRDDAEGTGEYRPERNHTIEALKERGVEVLPDGTGLLPSALTAGGGGVHCMTTPLSRG
ncbi:arginine deiminase family protein [Halorussus marinus]|uniref:arginine deiminase family protein n=1 Tax=Halorussus marinus TaxID=2505976 RepID=UPI00143030C3|nr:arginine deiminase family protein [Halorussus marinus]